MNPIMKEYWPIFTMYQAIRTQIMEMLTDEMLSFQPTPHNETLGALCLDIGQTEQSYIDSFKTGRHDFSYQHPNPAIATSVEQLKNWYAELDEALQDTISSFTTETLQTTQIDRGGGFILPVQIQLEIYKEALLIFYGKTSIYLKAMGHPLPKQMQEWIG